MPELVQTFDISAGTIRRYIHAFNEAGLAGLQPDYGQGRPLALTWTCWRSWKQLTRIGRR